MADKSITVLIVDDHPMVRTGLRSMLTASGFEVVGEAASGQEALEKVALLNPDITLMDIRMPDMDGITALEKINANKHPTRVIMVTTYKNTTYLLRALAAGAAGFVLKNIAPDEMIITVRAIAAGESRVDQSFLQSVLNTLANDDEFNLETNSDLIEALTPRELEVLQLIVEGLPNQAIANVLGISLHTIKGYVQTIFQKLYVSDRTQAAVKAIRLGLVK